ncbi:MAG: PDZ domain-containing protein, partial [Phycisphaeraceae bacterium]|nr:PDZ domain-containing protein [Phycisphaeraceae bacterium]
MELFMFTRQPHATTGWAALALVGLLVASSPAQEAAPQTVSADQLARKAWNLARDGRLKTVWDSIRKLPGDDQQLQSLQSQLEGHLKSEATQRQARLAEFNRHIQDLEKHQAAGELEKALTSAIVATPLAEDPQAFLAGERVGKLTKVVEKKAAELEKQHDWLDALNLYGGLERLYDNEHRYTKEYRRVARRVAALRLYAPKLLYKLYVEQAKQRDQDPPEPWKIEPDHWKTQLRDIEPRMLYDSLALASRQHIEGVSIKTLLLGGFEALEQVLDTQGLEATFPVLADEAKAGRFVKYLRSLRKEIAKLAAPIDPNEANQFIGLLLEENDLTLKLPQRLLIYELGNGAMEELDDYSVIVWPHQKSLFERTTQGKFFGVGIQITLVHKQLTVVTPLEGTPAHRARIKAGDKIVKIDGQSTIGFSLAQAVEKITGPKGTPVELAVQSPEDEKPRTIRLIRAE